MKEYWWLVWVYNQKRDVHDEFYISSPNKETARKKACKLAKELSKENICVTMEDITEEMRFLYV